MIDSPPADLGDLLDVRIGTTDAEDWLDRLAALLIELAEQEARR